MGIALLLDGVRALLLQSVGRVATEDLVDRLVEAVTEFKQACALLRPVGQEGPGDFLDNLDVLKKGSTHDRIQFLLGLKIRAEQSPASFEVPEHLEPRPGEARSPNVLALTFAAAQKDEDETVRLEGLLGLQILRHRAAPVIAIIALQIADPLLSIAERKQRVRVLAHTQNAEAAWALMPRLETDDDLDMRKEAAAGLAELGPCAAFAVISLLSALRPKPKSPKEGETAVPFEPLKLEELRTEIRHAVRRVDPELKEVFPLLCRGLEERWYVHFVRWIWERVRRAFGKKPRGQYPAKDSAELIGLLGPMMAAAVPNLLRTVHSSDASTREAALRALRVVSPKNPGFYKEAKRLLGCDADPAVRIAACECLETIARTERTPDEFVELQVLFRECSSVETDENVRAALAKTAEKLWGTPLGLGSDNPEDWAKKHFKKQVAGNIISLCVSLFFRFLLFGIRKFFGG